MTGKSEQIAGSAEPLPDGTIRPIARPETLAVTSDETASAAPVASLPKGALGATVVSLGTPTEPGLWLKTPLASAKGKGQVRYKGKSVEVQLIPIEGEASAGSRLSMQAMQGLGIPLTDLVEVQVSVI